MRVAFVGDLHGNTRVLKHLPKDVDRIIQIGDLGFIHNPERWPVPHTHGREVEFIDGNHDSIDVLRAGSKDYTEKYAVNENLTYIPRGHVERLGNTLVGFMGGGESIDRAMRTPFVSWFPEETIMAWQVRRMVKLVEEEWGGQLDVLVTHVPPIEVAHAIYPCVYHEFSISSNEVSNLVAALHPKKVICGHAHCSLNKMVNGVRVIVLNIDEVLIEEL